MQTTVTDNELDTSELDGMVQEAETVIYNQIIFLPNQKRELAALDKKKDVYKRQVRNGQCKRGAGLHRTAHRNQ